MKPLLLGILQGLTEFLPVSSSGHLVVFETILKFNRPGIAFEVMLHLATALAIVLYFRGELLTVLKSWRYIVAIIVGSVPAGVVGILFKDSIDQLFNGLSFVEVAFLANGVILILGWRFRRKERRELNYLTAFLIGVAQAIAIFPGISRSGATITMGIILGLSLEDAFKFSFFLSLPAILGASLLEMTEMKELMLSSSEFFGFLSAFVFGLAALAVLRRSLLKGKICVFGYYTIILALLLIIIDKGICLV